MCSVSGIIAQQDSLQVKNEDSIRLLKKQLRKAKRVKAYDPLAPAKAAFYSAVVPGLGQAYNGRYWKIPLVYGALVTTFVVRDFYDGEYNRFRDAYRRRLNGFDDDEFADILTDDNLIDLQQNTQRTRDVWTLLTVAAYILNIVDANVDAHLQQFNVSDQLTINPDLRYDQFTGLGTYGIALQYNF
ncbi:DUF5683 domain-containing protein [Gangjinia marincola]|uniref:DUF5683 domain-containing protein n=1 Tax=Gangjinia marincola TaxID=578463 RepID=A0ABN1MJB9_9FLAO